MTAHITDLRAWKARRIALAKAARVRSLAEELAFVAPAERDETADFYVDKGWASEAEIRMALELLPEDLSGSSDARAGARQEDSDLSISTEADAG